MIDMFFLHMMRKATGGYQKELRVFSKSPFLPGGPLAELLCPSFRSRRQNLLKYLVWPLKVHIVSCSCLVTLVRLDSVGQGSQ